MSNQSSSEDPSFNEEIRTLIIERAKGFLTWMKPNPDHPIWLQGILILLKIPVFLLVLLLSPIALIVLVFTFVAVL